MRIHLKQTAHVLSALSLLLGAVASAQTQKNTPQNRVEQISAAASLVRESSAPWHLRMTFQLYDLNGKPSETGTVEEWWVSPQSHRLVITSPSYNTTEPAAPDDPHTYNRLSFLLHELVKQVVDPVPQYGDFKNLKVVEEDRKISKVQLNCYYVMQATAKVNADEPFKGAQFCTEPGHDELRLHLDGGEFAAVRNRMGKFRSVELGLDNSLSYAGKMAITGHIEILQSYDPAEAPVELTQARPQPAVPGIVLAGKIVKKVPPVYPIKAKQERLSGSVTLCALISTEGKISYLDVVATPDKVLSESSVDAVKQWTYTPYLINGEPVTVATTITVNYNLNDGGPIFIR